jgi:hypothetical protein
MKQAAVSSTDHGGGKRRRQHQRLAPAPCRLRASLMRFPDRARGQTTKRISGLPMGTDRGPADISAKSLIFSMRMVVLGGLELPTKRLSAASSEH